MTVQQDTDKTTTTGKLLTFPGRLEVRHPDATGPLLGIAEHHADSDTWDVYPDLTGSRKSLIGATRAEAEALLRDAWNLPDPVDQHAAEAIAVISGGAS